MNALILMDVNELYHSVGKSNPGKKFNYAQFLKKQEENLGEVHAIACVDNALDRGRNFVAMLKANNYTVHVGERRVFFTFEAMRHIDKADTFIFGTASDAYIPMYNYLMMHGKGVFLISPNIRPHRFDVTGILDMEDEFLFAP